MPHERLEDVLREAFSELALRGDIYLADFAESLSPGLGRGPARALFKLQRLGPLRVKDLATQLRLDSTTVSRHVNDLESRGLVVRRPDPTDRRAVLVQLAPRTVAILEGAEAEHRNALREGLLDWSQSDRADFVRLLSRFVQRDDLAAHVAATTFAQPPQQPAEQPTTQHSRNR